MVCMTVWQYIYLRVSAWISVLIHTSDFSLSSTVKEAQGILNRCVLYFLNKQLNLPAELTYWKLNSDQMVAGGVLPSLAIEVSKRV